MELLIGFLIGYLGVSLFIISFLVLWSLSQDASHTKIIYKNLRYDYAVENSHFELRRLLNGASKSDKRFIRKFLNKFLKRRKRMEQKTKKQRIRELLDLFEEDLQYTIIYRDGMSPVVDIYPVYDLINNIREILSQGEDEKWKEQ